PISKRGTAYGIFNTIYGSAFLAGSALIGLLYDKNLLTLLFLFVALTQGLSIFILFSLMRSFRRDKKPNG
ncbi:MAG: MFS transporter, partial [Planctomycetota bacterium]|nr:MFS transporter [Planctomycetota bacterium]